MPPALAFFKFAHGLRHAFERGVDAVIVQMVDLEPEVLALVGLAAVDAIAQFYDDRKIELGKFAG
jgi:hypothetical protein